MYLTGQEITISWVINATEIVASMPSTQFDVLVVDPAGVATYYTDPLTSFIEPIHTSSVITAGAGTYTFTPDTVGYWQVKLVTGTAASFEILDTVRINAVCAPNEDEYTNADAYPVQVIQAREACVARVSMARATMTGWNSIQALGRGAGDNEIVIVGNYDNPDTNHNYDLGIYNIETDTMTLYLDFVDDIPGFVASSIVNWAGVDCDPVTGTYVVVPNNDAFINNYYDAYWCDDLDAGPAVWTKQTGASTQFHGSDFIRWYETMGMFLWNSGSTTYVSADGKAWSSQTARMVGGGSVNIGYSREFPANPALNPINSDVMIAPGDNSFIYRLEQSGSDVPVSDTGAWVTADSKTISENSLNDGNHFGHAGNYDIEGGVAWSAAHETTPVVCVMNTYGEIIYAEGAGNSMARDDWQVAAERDEGQMSPVGPTSELTDQDSPNWREFTRFNEKWWVNRGGYNWWYYDGNIPIGEGWVQTVDGSPPSDMPFQYNGERTSISRHCILQCTQRPLAWAGAQENGDGLAYIYYDENAESAP